MKPATLLFAHGSSRTAWRDAMERLLTSVRDAAEPGTRVELCFLELCEPDLPTAVEQLRAEGVTRVRVLPAFMSGGGHVLRDLPPLVERIRAAHPALDLRVEPAIGEHPAVIAALAALASAP